MIEEFCLSLRLFSCDVKLCNVKYLSKRNARAVHSKKTCSNEDVPYNFKSVTNGKGSTTTKTISNKLQTSHFDCCRINMRNTQLICKIVNRTIH